MDDDHDRYRDDVAAYVLGSLSEVETAALEPHLQDCEACTRDLERLRTVVDRLSIPVAPQTTRSQLKEEMLQRIREGGSRERVRRSRRTPFGGLAWGRPALVAAGLLASVALVVGGYGLGSSVSGESRQELRAAVDPAHGPGVSATLERRGDLGVLRTSNLPPLADGVYVVWIDRGAGPRFASSFNVGDGGTAEAGVASLEGVESVMVTSEATARVSRPTMRPILTVELQ